MARKLTAKQQAYVREVLVDGDHVAASKRAGYQGAILSHWELRRHARLVNALRDAMAADPIPHADDPYVRELLAAMLAHPTAPGPLGVYADHLIDRGDPHGPAIAATLNAPGLAFLRFEPAGDPTVPLPIFDGGERGELVLLPPPGARRRQLAFDASPLIVAHAPFLLARQPASVPADTAEHAWEQALLLGGRLPTFDELRYARSGARATIGATHGEHLVAHAFVRAEGPEWAPYARLVRTRTPAVGPLLGRRSQMADPLAWRVALDCPPAAGALEAVEAQLDGPLDPRQLGAIRVLARSPRRALLERIRDRAEAVRVRRWQFGWEADIGARARAVLAKTDADDGGIPPALLDQVRSPDLAERRGAIRAIARLHRDPAAIDALVDSLAYPHTRVAAIEALRACGASGDLLLDLHERHGHLGRVCAALAQAIATRDEPRDRLHDYWVDVLRRSPDTSVSSYSAFQAINRLEFTDALTDALVHASRTSKNDWALTLLLDRDVVTPPVLARLRELDLTHTHHAYLRARAMQGELPGPALAVLRERYPDLLS